MLKFHEAKRLLDILYPENDANQDKEIRQFRDTALEQLNFLQANPLTDSDEGELQRFIQQLKTILANQGEINQDLNLHQSIGIASGNYLGPGASQYTEIHGDIIINPATQPDGKLVSFPHIPSFGLPPDNHYSFVGHVKELKILNEQFKKSKESSHVVSTSIFGLGGVGKTQLAIYYLYHAVPKPTLRFWFHADTSSALYTDYLKFAQFFKLLRQEDNIPREELIVIVKDYLAKYSGWIAIYDDVSDYSEIKPFLPIFDVSGHVILTTRRQEDCNEACKIGINKFDDPEAIEFFKKKLQSMRKEPFQKNEENAIKELVKELGCLPLALAQAGAYVNKCGISITACLTLYRDDKKKMLQENRLPRVHNQSVATVWNISLRAIQQKEEELVGYNKLSMMVLQAMSYLHADKIPRLLLEEWISKLSTKTTPKRNLDNAIDHLSDYSMIQKDRKTVSVHVLVQEVVRDEHLQHEDKEKLVSFYASILVSLNKKFPSQEFQRTRNARKKYERLLPHYKQVLDHYSVLEKPTDSNQLKDLELLIAKTRNNAGIACFFYYDEKNKAKYFLELALAVRREHEPEGYDTAWSCNNVGRIYINMDDKEAKVLLEEALCVFQKQFSSFTKKNWLSMSLICNNLGLALLKLFSDEKDKVEALYYITWALHIRMRCGGLPQDIALSQHYVAQAYLVLGDRNQAEIFFKKAIKFFDTDQEYLLDKAQTLIGLSLVYFLSDQTSEALTCFQEAKGIRRKIYHSEDVPIVEALECLGAAYEKASNKQKVALEELRKIYLDQNKEKIIKGRPGELKEENDHTSDSSYGDSSPEINSPYSPPVSPQEQRAIVRNKKATMQANFTRFYKPAGTNAEVKEPIISSILRFKAENTRMQTAVELLSQPVAGQQLLQQNSVLPSESQNKGHSLTSK